MLHSFDILWLLQRCAMKNSLKAGLAAGSEDECEIIEVQSGSDGKSDAEGSDSADHVSAADVLCSSLTFQYTVKTLHMVSST